MGTFDEEIAAALAGGARSQRGGGIQDVRDMLARRHNVAERGINSTAYPYPGAGGNPASAQFPPAPAAAVAAAIDQQLGDNVPTPSPRPNGGGQVQGPPMPSKEYQQMGDASAMEEAQKWNNPGKETAVADGAAGGGGGFGDWLIGVGGSLAGLRLVKRAQMGDVEAQRAVAASGLDLNSAEQALRQLNGATNAGVVDAEYEVLNGPTQKVGAPQTKTPLISEGLGVDPMTGEVIDPARFALPNRPGGVVTNPDGGRLPAPPQQTMRYRQTDGGEAIELADQTAKKKAKSAKNLASSRPRAKTPKVK